MKLSTRRGFPTKKSIIELCEKEKLRATRVYEMQDGRFATPHRQRAQTEAVVTRLKELGFECDVRWSSHDIVNNIVSIRRRTN